MLLYGQCGVNMNEAEDDGLQENVSFNTNLPIMDWKEFAEKQIEYPHIFSIKIGNSEIEYFGSFHSRDPRDTELFDRIKDDLEKSHPDLVVIEGVEDLENRNDEMLELTKNLSYEQAIETAGEAGFTAKLAMERDIEVKSPEPKLREEADFILSQGFSQGEVFAYYVTRDIAWYHKLTNKPDLEKYLEPVFRDFARRINWPGFDFSRKHYSQLCEQIWGHKLDMENAKFFSAAVDPSPWEGKKTNVINAISQASASYRDMFVVNKLLQYSKKYKKIFVVFGGSHAVVQEPALRYVALNYKE